MKNKSSRDFSRKKIYEVAMKFVEGDSYQHSVANLAQYYDTTESTMRTILANAIIKGVVCDKTVHEMEEKMKRNAYKNASKNQRRPEPEVLRVEKKYEERRQKRSRYMPSNKEAINIATQLANSQLGFYAFASSNYITPDLLLRIVSYCVDKNFVGTDVKARLLEKTPL